MPDPETQPVALLARRPLNGLQPRTLQDAHRDPYDWVEPPCRDARLDEGERVFRRLLLAAAALVGLGIYLRWLA